MKSKNSIPEPCAKGKIPPKGDFWANKKVDLDAELVVVPAVTLNETETESSGPKAEARMRLFISYAHLNEKEWIPLRPHLTHLSEKGYIQVWNDRDLVPGERFEDEITEALQRADIVLLFYTTAARVSPFIQNTELPMALARSDAKQCTIIWVPLERSDLDEDHPLERRLAKLACGTTDKRPIYDFDKEQKGWMEVEHAIRRAVEARRKLVR
jgi:hypothetical protein